MINNDNAMCSTLIVEDDPIMQQRLQSILIDLGYQSSDLIFAQSLDQARSKLKNRLFSICICDLGLPDGNGCDLIKEMRTQFEDMAILVVSACKSREAILTAIQAGATGYLLKERDNFELTLAVRSVIRGGAPIDPFMAQQILKQLITPSVQTEKISEEIPQVLSKRELTILEYVAKGLSNREIATELNLSYFTVESHIKNIYKKLSVNNRNKAINTAKQIGLL